MDNVIINLPQKIEEDVEDFKIDACEDEKNFTVSRVKLCRNPDNEQPVLFYSQELIRNFKNPHDPLGKRHLIKAFTPNNFTAAADITLERKFSDTVLAHKTHINNYSPLTDIHSQKMNLFLDEDTATFLSDVGVNIGGLSEDFQSIESVAATPFMEDIAGDANKIKQELAELKRSYNVIKNQMADEFDNYIDPKSITDEEFAERLAHEKISEVLVQSYLSLTEKITKLEVQLGQISSTVFKETACKIRLPGLLNDIQNKEAAHELLTL